MQHFDDAYSYWATANRLVWSTDQNPTNWNVKDYNMARRDKELNFRVEDVENGFILTLGGDYSGYSGRYVFSTIKELNEFIAKRNAEILE